MDSPKMAHTIQAARMAAPTRNVALRASSRHRAVARAGTATGVTVCVIVTRHRRLSVRWRQCAAAG